MGLNCESCGIPMKKDKKGGGTEADGSKSTMYCSECYKKGRFRHPDMTVEDMQKRMYNKLKEQKFPGFLAKMMTKGIPSLERWREVN